MHKFCACLIHKLFRARNLLAQIRVILPLTFLPAKLYCCKKFPYWELLENYHIMLCVPKSPPKLEKLSSLKFLDIRFSISFFFSNSSLSQSLKDLELTLFYPPHKNNNKKNKLHQNTQEENFLELWKLEILTQYP